MQMRRPGCGGMGEPCGGLRAAAAVPGGASSVRGGAGGGLPAAAPAGGGRRRRRPPAPSPGASVSAEPSAPRGTVSADRAAAAGSGEMDARGAGMRGEMRCTGDGMLEAGGMDETRREGAAWAAGQARSFSECRAGRANKGRQPRSSAGTGGVSRGRAPAPSPFNCYFLVRRSRRLCMLERSSRGGKWRRVRLRRAALPSVRM